MTKKDYELIASAFRAWSFDFGSPDGKFADADSKLVFDTLVEEVAIKLAHENPKFDIAKFEKACGL